MPQALTADRPALPSTQPPDVAVRTSAGVHGAMQENQDNYLVVDGQGQARFLRGESEQAVTVAGWPAGHVRLAVLDGMGGHGNGRQAAEAAAEALLGMPPCTTVAQLAAELDLLHARLQERFDDMLAAVAKRPGTTLTLLEMPPGAGALLYHVGDSRLYEIDGDTIAPLTVDHVPATAYAMDGLYDEDTWWDEVHTQHRPQIAQAFILGNTFAVPGALSDPLYELTPGRLPRFLRHLPDRRVVDLSPLKTYVLATDGFWSCAEANRWVAQWPCIVEPGRNAREKVDALFREMEEHTPPGLHVDNLTAIVVCPQGGGDAAPAVPGCAL